jgi:hypothetical protein
MTPLGRAAVKLGERGLLIFPCWPRTKKPCFADNLRLAAVDPTIIGKWWGERGQFNIAVATGPGSGIWVLDIDGWEGERTLRQLEERHGALPPTVESITGRGRHLYWRWPSDIEIRNTQLRGDIPGVEVRGEGGYALAPPSVHPSGRAYAWSVDSASEFADAPEWLLDLVKTDRRNGGDDRDDAPQPTQSEVWRVLLDCDHEGSRREAAIVRLAGLLLRRFVDPYATLGLCHVFNEGRCREPLARTEVVRIVGAIAERELARRERAQLAAGIQQSEER